MEKYLLKRDTLSAYGVQIDINQEKLIEMNFEILKFNNAGKYIIKESSESVNKRTMLHNTTP